MMNLSPIGWALRPLKNYANFSGRASRAEFWWFSLFMMIIYMLVWFVLLAAVGVTAASVGSSATPSPLRMIGAFGIAGIFLVVFYLALLIPSIAVQMRRLHDTNRSGWWLGAFWLLYLAYLVVAFSSVFSMRVPSDGSPPNMGSVAAMSMIGLIFFVYSIVLLVFFCLAGTKGANRFGDDPYGANVEEVFA